MTQDRKILSENRTMKMNVRVFGEKPVDYGVAGILTDQDDVAPRIIFDDGSVVIKWGLDVTTVRLCAEYISRSDVDYQR